MQLDILLDVLGQTRHQVVAVLVERLALGLEGGDGVHDGALERLGGVARGELRCTSAKAPPGQLEAMQLPTRMLGVSVFSPAISFARRAVVENARAITTPYSSVAVFTLGGAVARVPADATAFPNRDAAHDINIVGAWPPDSPDADDHVAWVRTFFDALEPYSRGVYVNFTNDDSTHRVQTSAYSASQWHRLVGLKATWDPDNFFRGNANIPPLG